MKKKIYIMLEVSSLLLRGPLVTAIHPTNEIIANTVA